jgi:choline dehydrogenase-like flavoprotein
VSENYSWPITSLPTAGLNNRTTSVIAARILGGGSAINGMAFTRGSPGDYDLWAELVGDDAWGWDGLLPYFKKVGPDKVSHVKPILTA